MNVTIETLRAEFAQLSKKLESFERQPQYPIIINPTEVKDGQRYIGTIISADGTHRKHIVLLPGEFYGNLADCEKWAADQGGVVPDRVGGALLFSLKAAGMLDGEFKDEWYWTRDRRSSNTAFIQYFNDGLQSYYDLSCECRVRAVSEIHI